MVAAQAIIWRLNFQTDSYRTKVTNWSIPFRLTENIIRRILFHLQRAQISQSQSIIHDVRNMHTERLDTKCLAPMRTRARAHAQ